MVVQSTCCLPVATAFHCPRPSELVSQQVSNSDMHKSSSAPLQRLYTH